MPGRTVTIWINAASLYDARTMVDDFKTKEPRLKGWRVIDYAGPFDSLPDGAGYALEQVSGAEILETYRARFELK